MQEHTVPRETDGLNGVPLLQTTERKAIPARIKTIGELYDYCVQTVDSSPAWRGHRAVWRYFSEVPDGGPLTPLAQSSDQRIRRLFADCDDSYKYYPVFGESLFD